jgi:NAD(P)-dependent dehydrogenase (short-subunit alcohol dehydrogenase family)
MPTLGESSCLTSLNRSLPPAARRDELARRQRDPPHFQKAIQMPKLDGKVIIVTGSTQGVGEAVAMHAASEGAKGVVICGRQEALGTAVAAALTERGTRPLYVQADLSVVADCRRIVERCDETFGRVDGLVNAAADTNRGTLEDTTVEFWDYQFAVNVRAPFLLTQACVNIMKREQIEGSIVNILSVAAYCGMDILVSYSSTKGALSTFTKNTANGLRRQRIRVNGINLGWTDTPNEHVVQSLQGNPVDWLEKAEHQSPFGRLLKPDDVARLCIYLLSDDSGILTGSNIDFSQRVMGMAPPETGIKA